MKAPSLAEVRKTLVAAAAVLAQAVELGVLHGAALHYAQAASSLAGVVLVYLVPNARPKPAPTALAFDAAKVQHPDAETPAPAPPPALAFDVIAKDSAGATFAKVQEAASNVAPPEPPTPPAPTPPA